jgi:hypothetical protein
MTALFLAVIIEPIPLPQRESNEVIMEHVPVDHSLLAGTG